MSELVDSMANIGNRGLIKKLCEVMAEAGTIKKRGFNERFNYHYATEADVVDELRDRLASRNIFIFPSVVSVERKVLSQTAKGADMFVTDIMMRWTFVDGDTGETHDCMMPGCGSDTGDKSLYKAITGCSKYLFLKGFMLPTGDDPEDEKQDRDEGIKAAQSVATSKLRSKDGSEILNITPYMEGFAALSGSGLAIVRANMDNAIRGQFGWTEKGNVVMVPVDKVPALLGFCTFHDVRVSNDVPAAQSKPEPKPNGHAPATPFSGDGTTDPIIMDAKILKTKAKKEFLLVKWNGRELSCFHNSLFPFIIQFVNKPAFFEISKNGKYENLEKIVRLGGMDFSMPEKPYEASDADIPF